MFNELCLIKTLIIKILAVKPINGGNPASDKKIKINQILKKIFEYISLNLKLYKNLSPNKIIIKINKDIIVKL